MLTQQALPSAIAGDLPTAAQALEAALRFNPNQTAARANLRRVRARMANGR